LDCDHTVKFFPTGIGGIHEESGYRRLLRLQSSLPKVDSLFDHGFTARHRRRCSDARACGPSVNDARREHRSFVTWRATTSRTGRGKCCLWKAMPEPAPVTSATVPS